MVRLPLLLTALALLVPPAAAGPTGSVTWDTTLLADGDAAAHTQGSLGGERLYARLDSAAGWQFADVQTSCIPDLEAECDTVVDCEPGSLNCWATRRERPPFPCRWVPPGNGSEGHIVCNFPNQTEPEPEPGPAVPSAACEDVLSRNACRALPRQGDDPAQACRRALARDVCDALPPQRAVTDACREVFAARVCALAELPRL